MARRLGFGWGETARMASWNPCRFYGLEDRGNVREGYVADLVVTDDACNRIVYVIKDGRLVAAEGRLTGTTGCGAAPRRDFPNTVRFREMHAADFTPARYDEKGGHRIGGGTASHTQNTPGRWGSGGD